MVGRMGGMGENRDTLNHTDQEGRAWLGLLCLPVSDDQNLCPAEV